MKPKVIILDEPTKGIDVGAKAEIYQMICHVAKQGIAVIFISSELTEVIGLSDRILVLKDGSITKELPGGNVTEQEILSWAMLDREGNGG